MKPFYTGSTKVFDAVMPVFEHEQDHLRPAYSDQPRNDNSRAGDDKWGREPAPCPLCGSVPVRGLRFLRR